MLPYFLFVPHTEINVITMLSIFRIKTNITELNKYTVTEWNNDIVTEWNKDTVTE